MTEEQATTTTPPKPSVEHVPTPELPEHGLTPNQVQAVRNLALLARQAFANQYQSMPVDPKLIAELAQGMESLISRRVQSPPSVHAAVLNAVRFYASEDAWRRDLVSGLSEAERDNGLIARSALRISGLAD